MLEPINLNDVSCCGDGDKDAVAEPRTRPGSAQLGLALIAGAIGWPLLYFQLLPFSRWLTFSFLGLTPGSHLGEALAFFIYDTPKVLMLLSVAVFLIGVLRSYVTAEWTRRVLAGRNEYVGNVLAALLGVVTPFCSCSAVPLFIGFMTAGVPLGVTLSYLIAAPMVNEIALIMLYGLLGWRIALLYFVTGIGIAVLAGWILGRMRLESHIEEWVMLVRAGDERGVDPQMDFFDRIMFGYDSVREIVGKVWKYVVLGIFIGAAIHGYVPEGYLAGIMGDGNWWSVPASVLIGIPIYSNAAGVIPVVDALLGKGAALGTVIAFMMSVIALSLPEMIILRKVLKPRLIGVFIGVVGTGILLVGYLFNLVV
jgi:uncharacterized membrane protein YraQ (UPF0718 family)